MMHKTLLALAVSFSLFVTPTQASTTFSGTITGDVVWTKANSPYLVNYVTIPQGLSLTIEPGTIIKVVDNGYPFTVEGTLTIGQNDAEPVIITSISDDAVGGDTNGDGAITIPHAGDWRQITVNQGGIVTLTNTIIKYGGATPYNPYTGGYFTLPLIANNGGTLVIDHSTLTQSGYYGILQESGTTTVTNSTFTHIGNWGIYATQGALTVASTTFDTMERGIVSSGSFLSVRNNTFTNLTAHYAISVGGAAMEFRNHGGNSGEGGILLSLSFHGTTTLPKDGLPYIAQYAYVPAGATLTILPGAIVKVSPNTNPFTVEGTLIVGTAGVEHVTMTSMSDDTIGGDTNGDGTTTTPQGGDWRTITFNQGSVGTFTNTTIRYGGRNEYSSYWGTTFTAPMIENNGGILTFTDTTITHAAFSALEQQQGTTTILHSELAHTAYGIYLPAGTGGGMVVIHDSHIHDNSFYALYNTTGIPLDATNNYWGSPTGPTHPSNPSGTGDRVTNNVSFTPWLGAVPATTTDPCVGVENCFSNVLFLPGIEASRLFETNVLGDENQLWEPNRNDDVRKLYLDENGTTLRHGIYAKENGVMNEINVTGANIYESFIDAMYELQEAETINEWKPIAYDWRLSLEDILANGKRDESGHLYYSGAQSATTSPYIIQELRRLAENSKTKKVTIIAHSNGGLVAKALLNKLEETNDPLYNQIDKIIFVAVPQVGTPEAIGALLNGFHQNHFPVLNTETARTFAENMPSGYNLLPSEAYFSGVGSSVTTPVIQFAPGLQTALFRNSYGNEIDNFGALQAFLRGTEGRPKPSSDNVTYPNVLNPSLLTAAFVEHDLLDAWTPPAGVKVHQIAGWGIDTLETIKYKQGSYLHCLGLNPCLSYDTLLTEDGDGTVVVPSALAMGVEGVQKYWVDLETYNTGPTIDRSHADILEVVNVEELIQNIVQDNNKILPLFISTSTPKTSFLKRFRYFLHSPLSLDLYDGEGNHTGISTSTGFIENQIPGAYYREFGEVKYITAPASTTLHLVLNGQASGYFTLDIQEVIDSTITATTSFVDIPTATTTTVTMDFTDGTILNAGALNVDEDGNGTTDFSLVPKLNDIVTLPPYSFSGFLQPINDVVYHSEQTPSVFKGGSTIPVKFQLKSTTGTLVHASTSPLWLTPQKLSSMSASSNESSTVDLGTSGATFKWDSINQQYIYNWSTKGFAAGWWYRIYAKLDDGTTQSVVVGLR